MIDESKINPNIDKLHRYFDSVLSKYFQGEKPIEKYFEDVPCYNCGSTETVTEFTVNRFRHVRCKTCGMVYTNPRLKESITHDMYSESDYSEFYKIKLIPAIEYRKNVLATRKYNQIQEHFKKPGRVLDIGCGLGENLSVFKDNGWDCTGVEFNSFAADYARNTFGLNIINKSIYDFDTASKYDLIMLWGVLEHFFDPKKVLRSVHSLLNPDGLLVLEVPSADSVMVRYYEATQKTVDRIIEGDRHIMLFSVRSFREMLENTGFSVLDISSNGLDASTLNRIEMANILDLAAVNRMQDLFDESLQGDLLRGFFRKR
jgi:2-polyprenyl-3-methyl-5-hydroxy-6-metoxy-1,4-benzoquinol methylase/ribosomal protein S27E